jgi:hypothetical protein
MVKKAIELFQRKGKAALAEITGDKDHYFSHKDMYVFAFNRDGQYLAFGGNAEKLKLNLFHLTASMAANWWPMRSACRHRVAGSITPS